MTSLYQNLLHPSRTCDYMTITETVMLNSSPKMKRKEKKKKNRKIENIEFIIYNSYTLQNLDKQLGYQVQFTLKGKSPQSWLRYA